MPRDAVGDGLDMPNEASGNRTSAVSSAPPEAPEDLVGLVGRLNMAIKACAAYPLGHPVSSSLVRVAYDAAADAVRNHGDLLFLLVEGKLTVNGYQFSRRELAPRRLAQCLSERDIRALTVEPTPEFEAFARLAQVLGRPAVELAAEGGAEKALGSASHVALTMIQYDRAFSVPAAGQRPWRDDPLAMAVAKYMAGTGFPDPGLQALFELLKRPQEVRYLVREDSDSGPASAAALAATIRRLLVAILTQAGAAHAQALAARLAGHDGRFRPLTEAQEGLSASDVIEATEGMTTEELTSALDSIMDMDILSRENLAGALAEGVEQESLRAAAPEAAAEDGTEEEWPPSGGGDESLLAYAEADDLEVLVGGEQDRRSQAQMLIGLLAGERDPGTVVALVAALEDVAVQAIEAGDAQVLVRIVRALAARSGEHEDRAILLEVQNARRRLADESNVLAILRRMGSTDAEWSREAWVRCLVELGEPALDACTAALTQPQGPQCAGEAAYVLARAGATGLACAARVLQEASAEGREACLEALGRLGDPAAAPTVATALNDPFRPIRQRAALLLGHLASTEVIEALGQVGRRVGWLDRDHVVREEAARALGHIDAPEAAEELVRAAEARSLLAPGRARRVARAAVQALAYMTDPAAHQCLAQLRQSPSRAARAAARSLPQVGASEGGGRSERPAPQTECPDNE